MPAPISVEQRVRERANCRGSFPEDTNMSITSMSARGGTIDPATGRLQPLTDQACRARSGALGRALEEIAAMTDETDTDEVWRDVMRRIDEPRPHRPLFEGSY